MYYKKVTEDIVFDTFRKKYINSCEVNPESPLNKLDIELINEVKERRNRKYLNLIVTITSECDLRCAYCFENHLQRKAMSMETCIDLLNEIKGYIETNDIETIDCVLFGGEPMLNQDVLLFFVHEFSVYCGNMNIELDMMMTTNGIICDEEFFIELSKNGVTSIQLSFDGTENTNNRRRCAKIENCNPYREIMHNIIIMINVFDVISVKYNFDQENCNEYRDFLRELGDAVGEKRNKITIILETINKTPFAEYGKEYDTTGRELAIQFIEMIKETINSNFYFVTRVFISPCMHTANNSYLIDTTGEAYSCISSYGIEEFKIGKFNRDIQDVSIFKRNKYTKLDRIKEHCKNCCYIPLCWGGCAYVLKSGGKDIYKDVQCRRVYFDTIIEAFYNEITTKYGVKRIE